MNILGSMELKNCLWKRGPLRFILMAPELTTELAVYSWYMMNIEVFYEKYRLDNNRTVFMTEVSAIKKQ